MTHAEALQAFSGLYHVPARSPAGIVDTGRAGLEVYRNNARANRSQALADAYPTVCALLGEEGFATLAYRYVENQPSPAADLHRDGAALPQFIAGVPELDDLPWLADCARLDWALHRAHRAEDLAAINPATLASGGEAGLAARRVFLHPAVALIDSAWPIAAILAFHHGGPPPDGAPGAQSVLVWRDHWQCVTPAESACLRALAAGSSLGAALFAGQTRDDNFDPHPLLATLLDHALIVGTEGVSP
jgi:hypothetical protein